MFVLLIDHEEDYGPPSVHGPFDTSKEAADYAERYRELVGLPIKATPDNNNTWTESGWYFGIFEPTRQLAPMTVIEINEQIQHINEHLHEEEDHGQHS